MKPYPYQFHSNKYKIEFSQNYIKSTQLAKEIIDLTNIDSKDLVLEIGPGRGRLTEFIVQKAKNVIAIEKDEKLFQSLRIRFSGISNTTIINDDFLKYTLPDNNKYKIIGNIPFALTSDIIRKILTFKNKPTSVDLIIQKEAALRFLGSDHDNNKENLFSLRFKPLYKGKIIKNFSSFDFSPRPKVNVVMLNISKRDPPLIEDSLLLNYYDFISYCFTSWGKNTLEVLKKLFTSNQLTIIRKKYQINLSLKPSEISFDQWLIIFNSFHKYGGDKQKEKINGTFKRLNNQQKSLIRNHRTRHY